MMPTEGRGGLGVPMRSASLVETGSLFCHTRKPSPLTYGQMTISP